jgi:hypothetical protein
VHHDGCLSVHLLQKDIHTLRVRNVEFFPDDVGVDGKLTSAAVDEDGESDALGASKVGELIECGPDRPAGIQHIVDDHDAFAFKVPGEIGWAHDRPRAYGLEVVAVEGDVEGASGDTFPFALLDELDETVSELDTTTLNADEYEIICSTIQLDDLVSHPPKGPLDGGGIEGGGILGSHRWTNMADGGLK